MKNTEIKPNSAKLSITMHKPKVFVKPGDITVNYMLVFFTLILAPSYMLLESCFKRHSFSFWFEAIIIVGLTWILFIFTLKTSIGIKLIQKIVGYLKETEIK